MKSKSQPMSLEKSEVLSCVRCHAKVYMYDDRYKLGEKIYWCPICKNEGRKYVYKVANVSYER